MFAWLNKNCVAVSLTHALNYYYYYYYSAVEELIPLFELLLQCRADTYSSCGRTKSNVPTSIQSVHPYELTWKKTETKKKAI